MLITEPKTTSLDLKDWLARWSEISPDVCWLDKPELGLFVIVANGEQRMVSGNNPDADDFMRVLHAVQCRSRQKKFGLFIGVQDGVCHTTVIYEQTAGTHNHETTAIAVLGALVQLEEKLQSQ